MDAASGDDAGGGDVHPVPHPAPAPQAHPAAQRAAVEFVPHEALDHRQQALHAYLTRVYTPELARHVLVPLLDQSAPVSLRLLDWAVVNWSKQHNIICSSIHPGQMTNVHAAYQSALAYWKRRLFDPFRRRERISVTVDGETHETTLGQANFAHFIHDTGILAYVIAHAEIIEEDMNRVTRMQRRRKMEARVTGRVSVRKELTKATRSVCVAYHTPTTIVFD